ncbi:MAG: hypothetical protein ACE5LB_01990 [Acidiferrobacterales bacterium]
MQAHVQLSLYIVAAVSVLWGVALFMDPQTVQQVLSRGPYDPSATGLVGAAMFAFSALFFIAALNPEKPLIHASIVALGFLSVVPVFLMFVDASMPQNLWTFFSMLVNLSVGLFLFFSVLTPQPARARGPRRKAAARRRPVTKKTTVRKSRKKLTRREPPRRRR